MPRQCTSIYCPCDMSAHLLVSNWSGIDEALQTCRRSQSNYCIMPKSLINTLCIELNLFM